MENFVNVTIPFHFERSISNQSQTTSDNTINEAERRIIQYINQNSKITIKQLVLESGYSDGYVRKILTSLKQKKRIQRQGGKKTGEWILLQKQIRISRIKVLRNYSLIHDGETDSLMAAIVKGSFLTSESIEKIAQSINYTLGGNDGLSKRVQPQ